VNTELLYVAGSGRSGSTLFDRLLDRHPGVVGLGEVHRLCLEPSERLCGCGSTIERCDFWSSILDALSRSEGIDRIRWAEQFPTTVVRSEPASGATRFGLLEFLLLLGSARALGAASRLSPMVARHMEMTRNSWVLYDLVAERTGAKLIVDSTKNAARLKLLYLAQPHRMKIIHLIRDGRAVASSARRRTGSSIRSAARSWYRANRNVELACRTIPADRVMSVRYEDLCTNTEQIMEKVCGFLDLLPAPTMFELEPHDYHQIPGNPMLFRSQKTEIVLDDRWRADFDESDQRDFDAVTHGMNLRYGYV